MDIQYLLIFAFFCIGAVILTYIVIITDKTREVAKKKQTVQTIGKVVPLSIFFLLLLYVVRFSLVAGIGTFSGVGIPVLIGSFVAVIPICITCLYVVKHRKNGGKQ